MKINVKELKTITKKISVVYNADDNANYLNIKSIDNILYFSLTNKEFYVSFKLATEVNEDFNATIATKAFVDMINSLSGDELSLEATENVLKLSAGKSKYKLPMIFADTVLKEPTPINVVNPTTTMVVPAAILASINDINSQEFVRVNENKIKNIANKLYHISDAGCFTAANSFGACLNSFTLAQPIDLLINRRIAKLLTLFTTDPTLTYELVTVSGTNAANAVQQAVINLTSDDIKLGALTTADQKIRAVVMGMVTKIRQITSAVYQQNLVINAKMFASALSRLDTAAKYTGNTATSDGYSVKLTVENGIALLTDEKGNSEEFVLENTSTSVGKYSVILLISKVKSIIDLCKSDTFTLRANNNSPIILEFGTVKYVLAPIAERD